MGKWKMGLSMQHMQACPVPSRETTTVDVMVAGRKSGCRLLRDVNIRARQGMNFFQQSALELPEHGDQNI
jgi:hypothetical protein